MNHEQLLYLIDEKVNEIILAYQEANNITDGDISPLDALMLESIEQRLANLITIVYPANH